MTEREGAKPTRRALKACGVLFACVLAMSATTAQAAGPLDLKQLPLQSPLNTLKVPERPLALGMDERIAGLHMGNNRRAKRDENNSPWPAVGVFDNAAAAERFAKEATFTASSLPYASGDTCFTVQLSPDGVTAGIDLDESTSSSTTTYAEVPEISGYPRVALVRAERLVDGQNARLEVVDFWVDNQTGGLRLIRHAELALEQVGESEMGLVAYAARTGDERFEVLVQQTLRPAERELYSTLDEEEKTALLGLQVNSPLVAVLGNAFLTSACGHLRFRMELPQPAPRAAAGTMEATFAQQAQVRRESAVVSSTALLAWEYDGEPSANLLREPQLNRVRTRPLSINFGLSRLSRDAAPVFSMSYRWTGPETTQFVAPMLASTELK